MYRAATESIESWALDYVTGSDLARKLDPPTPPAEFAVDQDPIRLSAPGRPPEFDLIGKTARSIPQSQLRNPRRRAQLIHTFLHHELQAAELMCWAILAFPGTPIPFRRGLLGICLDEIRHMGMHAAHLERLDHSVGDFPVRDWFWQRVAQCATPVQFVALMGMGLEAGNLDHTRRFEDWFRAAGDHEGAELQRVVGDEEIAHVRFGVHWFREWTADIAFETWRTELVEPLTPTMMKGTTLDTERRRQAGFPPAFLAELQRWDAR